MRSFRQIIFPSPRARTWILLALLASAVVLYIFAAPIGYLGVEADDFSFGRIVAELVRTGRYEHVSWSGAPALPQIYFAAALTKLLGGDVFLALHLHGLLSVLGLGVACFLLLRRLAFSIELSLLGTAVVGSLGTMAIEARQFLTNVPFLNLLLISSLLYVASFEERRWRLFAAASVVASLASLTRPFGLVLFAFGLAGLLLSGRGWASGRRRSVAILAVCATMGVAGYLWWFSLPHSAAYDDVISSVVRSRLSIADLRYNAVFLITATLVAIGNITLALSPLALAWLPVDLGSWRPANRWGMPKSAFAAAFMSLPLLAADYAAAKGLPLTGLADWAFRRAYLAAHLFACACVLRASATLAPPSIHLPWRMPEVWTGATGRCWFMGLGAVMGVGSVLGLATGVDEHYHLPTIIAALVGLLWIIERRGRYLIWVIVLICGVRLGLNAAYVDWTYHRTETPWRAAAVLQSAGFATDRFASGLGWTAWTHWERCFGPALRTPAAEHLLKDVRSYWWAAYLPCETFDIVVDPYVRDGFETLATIGAGNARFFVQAAHEGTTAEERRSLERLPW